MATLNITLSDDMRAFVESQVASGDYHNNSEFIRDCIRAYRRNKDVEKLEALLAEGLESGDAAPFTKDDWNQLRATAREKIQKRMSQES